jgi:competence protein ComEC
MPDLFPRENGSLVITFINVGYGESILVESEKNGEKITGLIDGGSGEDEEYSGDTGRIRARDFLGHKGIDVLDFAILTHIHEDHVCGLEQFAAAGGVIKKLFTVKALPQGVPELFINDVPVSGTRKFIAALNSCRRLLASLKKQNIPVVELDASAAPVPLAGDLSAEIITPSAERANLLFDRLVNLYRAFPPGACDSSFVEKAASLDAALNGFSLALMLNYRGKKIFLPGDATPEGLSGDAEFRQALVSGALRCDVLKLAHHGQIDGATEEFITAVSPEIIVTCSSSDHRYQSANPNLYRRIDSWLKQKPAYLFTDAIDMEANTLCSAPHSAVVIVIDSNGIVYSPMGSVISIYTIKPMIFI